MITREVKTQSPCFQHGLGMVGARIKPDAWPLAMLKVKMSKNMHYFTRIMAITVIIIMEAIRSKLLMVRRLGQERKGIISALAISGQHWGHL